MSENDIHANALSDENVNACDDVYKIGNMRFVNVTNKLPKEYEDMVIDISNLMTSKRAAEAMQSAQILLDNNMSNEIAWMIYALAKDTWGDRELAKKGFEQAIAINPKFAAALNEYGFFYVRSEDYNTAIDYFNRALECDEKNQQYMRDVAYCLMFTDSYDAAIEKCKYFISVADNKTYLENVLAEIYVECCSECVVDVPVNVNDPSQGTEPGFIYLNDIREVRKHCLEAKELLTLDSFSETKEKCESLLALCDDNEFNTFRLKKWPYLIFHTLITFIIYGFISVITWGIGVPFLIIATYANIKGDYFPMYMINYAYYTGTDDPLKYKEGSLRESVANGLVDGWRSSGENTYGTEMTLSFIQSRFWFLRQRLSFYKRLLRSKKKKNK